MACRYCGDPARGWLCAECWRLATISAVPAGVMGWLIGLLGHWLGQLGG